MAKRKNTQLKRVLAKSGQVYFFKGGKRIAKKKGEKLFTKEILKGQTQVPRNLTPQEELFLKRSKAAKKAAANTYKFKGRPIPRIYAVLLQKLYPKGDFLKTMDLSQWKKANGEPIFKRFSDIQRNIDNASKQDSEIFRLLTEMGYFKDKEGRTALIDICEIIQQKEYDKFKFILIDAQGDEVRGRVAVCTAIRDFEVDVTTDIKNALGMNVVKTYFDYSPNYDFTNKIFTLDIQDQDPDISVDEIVQAQKGELLLPNKKNKYKNVYITFSVS
jgi:hypothetical protein